MRRRRIGQVAGSFPRDACFARFALVLPHFASLFIVAGAYGQIVDPMPGRPAFVQPGGSLRVVLADDVITQPAVSLIDEFNDRAAIPLLVNQSSGEMPGVIFANVPEGTPRGVYTLRVRANDATYERQHAVSVMRSRTCLRILQLPGPMIGGLFSESAPWRIVDEINLLAPDAIVIAGGFVDPLAEDESAQWAELSDWLRRIRAPLIAAIGGRDDILRFSESLAPSAIGVVRIGPFDIATINNTDSNSLLHDAEQRAWLANYLNANTKRPRIVVSELACDDAGTLQTGMKPLLWLTDVGSEDSRDAASFASDHPAIADSAFLFDVCLAGNANAEPAAESKRAYKFGSLRMRVESIGNSSPAAVTIWNSSLTDHRGLEVVLRVPKRGATRPWVVGGRLTQLVDFGDHWDCTIATDSPAKSRIRVVAGTGTKPPELDIRATIRAAGAEFQSALQQRAAWQDIAEVTISNRNPSEQSVTPTVFVDDQPVRYRVAATAGPNAWGYALTIPPRENAVLQVTARKRLCATTAHDHEIVVYPAGRLSFAPARKRISCPIRALVPAQTADTTMQKKNAVPVQDASSQRDAFTPIDFRVRVSGAADKRQPRDRP